ncbi:MAG: TonB-dependent receptor [Bacteroidales bacterium]|nr:TonB-dependent receptor [Bacteroidales bacterium]
MKKNILFSWVTVILIMMSLLPTFAQQPDGPPPGAPQGPPQSGQRPGQRPGMDLNSMVTSTTGVIAGSLVDENAKPIPYASLYVLNAKDSSTVAYGMTSEEGRFVISKIPFGHSILKIDYMGYRTFYSQPFALSQNNPVYKMQQLKLDQKATMLGTVEVKAEREMLQSNLDKKVFNVGSSVTAEGATALEVLEDIPSVDVDLEGNVTLRGSENVTILVDGRPTNLTLDQIPANQIESIEVVTNPSARLEPDGMAGILNVVLKKKRESGFNGMVSLRGSMELFRNKPTLGGYGGNVSLNYSYGKINLFLNYDLRGHNHRNGGTMDRDYWFDTDTMHLSQDNTGLFGGMGHSLRTGLDWFINKKNTLSFTLSYNNNTHKGGSDLIVSDDSIRNGEYIPHEYYTQISSDRNVRHNFTASVNYKKTFETKGMELTSDLFYSRNHSNRRDTTAQEYGFPSDAIDIFQKTTTLDDNTTATGQVDFVTPVGKGGRIETGYKISYRSIGEDYRFFSGNDTLPMWQDYRQSNHFVFTEMINALYFIYSNSFWDKLKIQVGLRGEIANTKSDLKSAGEVHYKNYYNLFPTAHIRYDITKEHSLQVSYSRRVSRPNIWQLNPFLNVSDKQNYRCGNPDLTPEFVNSVELGYLMTIKKSSLNFTAFYRQRNDIISRFTEIFRDSLDGEPHTYTLTSYRNLNKSQNFGFELVYGQQLWKFWRITLSGSFYRVIIDSKEQIDDYLARDWTWNARLNQSFNLPKDWVIQVNFRYRAPSITTGSMGWGSGGVGQGKRSGSYSLDLGVKKSFLNKNLVVSLNIRNLLCSYKSKIITYMYRDNYGYDAVSIRDRGWFNVSLSVSYKINNYKKRREIPMDSGEEPYEE